MCTVLVQAVLCALLVGIALVCFIASGSSAGGRLEEGGGISGQQFEAPGAGGCGTQRNIQRGATGVLLLV